MKYTAVSHSNSFLKSRLVRRLVLLIRIWREVHENDLSESAKKDLLDARRNFGPSQASEVDVQGDNGHGTCKRDQADGHPVIHG